jgi:hypothetical protein
MKPIKGKLLALVKSKAPQLLDKAGDLLPDSGWLGVVKNIIDNDEDLTPEEKNAMREHLLEVFAKEVEDRQSARERQVQMVKAGAKDWLFSITGITGLTAFLFLAGTIVFLEVPENNEEIFIHLIGIVEGVALMIFSFYFGGIKKEDK